MFSTTEAPELWSVMWTKRLSRAVARGDQEKPHELVPRDLWRSATGGSGQLLQKVL